MTEAIYLEVTEKAEAMKLGIVIYSLFSGILLQNVEGR